MRKLHLQFNQGMHIIILHVKSPEAYIAMRSVKYL